MKESCDRQSFTLDIQQDWLECDLSHYINLDKRQGTMLVLEHFQSLLC